MPRGIGSTMRVVEVTVAMRLLALATSSCALTGLVNGHTYTISIVATSSDHPTSTSTKVQVTLGRNHCCIIGERERANLVVRSSGIFCLYKIYIRRTSCKCACAASNALLFIRNFSFQFFTHFHLSRYAPIDLASPRTLLHSTACAATFGDLPTLYRFQIFMVRRCMRCNLR